MGVKDALAEKTGNKGEVKLTKSMSIADMIKAMKPEIEKALPKVITPERFTRMALSALNTTPKLQECSQMSFLGALMNAAQLGLEPNTPLGQAYLIPYKNHGKLECQFQIGYKGLIDMVYRNDNIQTVQAQCVYEKDVFEYELGLEPKLVHKPAIKDRGELILVYALWKFVFRIKDAGGAPVFKIVEAEGGLWKNVAMKEIRDYFVRNLESEEDLYKRLTIIA